MGGEKVVKGNFNDNISANGFNSEWLCTMSLVRYHWLVRVKPGGNKNTTSPNKNSTVITERKQIGQMERSVFNLKLLQFERKNLLRCEGWRRIFASFGPECA